MSIQSEIRKHVTAGDLFVWQHAIASQQCPRCILVDKEMYEGFDEEYWEEPKHSYRLHSLRADLDHYIGGGEVAVGWHPFDKDDSAFMARTHHIERGVWDIRSRDPKPAIRVFGAFAEVDVFVALHWEYRTSLSTTRDWFNAIENALVRWANLFPDHAPHSGDNLHDFFSDSATIV